MSRLFGTDGVRGVANAELTAELAFNLGYAGARVLARGARSRPRFIVGKDTRISCDMLECALAAGITATGADVELAGVVPTPAIAYLTVARGADAGVVISASHNSYEFNGIKFFGREGYKLPDSVEDEIEAAIRAKGRGERGDDGFTPPSGGAVGRCIRNEDAPGDDYAAHLLASARVDLKGVKIALDCANGAAYDIAPSLFRALGAEVCAIHCEPDGVNINRDCGSTNIDAIRSFTVQCGADIGFAFDGDADRMLAVDERGGAVNGDTIMALLAIDMHGRGVLKGDAVVATVMSNLGLELAIREHGIRLVRTAVGDRYVLEEMTKGGYNLGGENSGHIICLDGNTTGDGPYAALRLLEVVFGGSDGSGGGRLSGLAGVVKAVPQVLLNAKVSNALKYAYREDEVIHERCIRLEELFKGEGRVVIRPSGTEPLVRVMIEATDRKLIEREAKSLVTLIEERLG